MYAIKSIQGNNCVIMDIEYGESDLTLTKKEVYETVASGNPIIGVYPDHKEIYNLANVVAMGMSRKGIRTKALKNCRIEIAGDARRYFKDEVLIGTDGGNNIVTVVNLKYTPNAKIALGLAGVK